jgi:hypothetical protein
MSLSTMQRLEGGLEIVADRATDRMIAEEDKLRSGSLPRATASA